MTLAALNACVCIPDGEVKHIYVYLDGSSNTIDSVPVMSWGFCCYKVDKDLNHDLFSSSGGIMCTDKESEWYFGAETCNSFTAELQSNVMARLWLLQSGITEDHSIIFLFDNQSAADAVVGKSVSRTNRTMCKIGIAIDRLCSKYTAPVLTTSIVTIGILGMS